MSKTILGFDIGTNSIGWALIEIDHEIGIVKIMGLGSRILPMDAGEINDFESSGKIKSSAAQRTEKRGTRRVNERFILRRDRLHLVLNLLNALPAHYKIEIDFIRNDEKCGQFKSYKEPKLAYTQNSINSKKYDFLFKESYQEMLNELGIEDKKGERIPYDWTLYYLRQKALKSEIIIEELAWVLLSYNQKRGYEKTEVEDKSDKENEFVEELDLRVNNVTELSDKEGNKFFKVELDSITPFIYNEYSEVQMTFKNDLKEVKAISKVDDEGNIDKGKTEFIVVDIFPLEIKDVKYEKQDGKHRYTLIYHNGWEEIKQPQNYTFRYENAKNKEYEYIVETIYDEKGNIKPIKGKLRKLREPDFSEKSNDWTLLKKKTEKEALVFNFENGYVNDETKESKKYISTKIYDILKKDAKSGSRTKIIGGMFQVVDRDFYREELNQIIETQKQFHNSLKEKEVFEQCANTLYPKNEAHAKTLLANKNAIQHLLVEDILLYQRPLKSKKSEIADCKYEIKHWKDVFDKEGKVIEEPDLETGELKIKREPFYHKAVSASHPYFQEFRIWDKLHNLRLIQLEKVVDGKVKTNVDVTDDYFTTETYEQLFELLNNQKTLTQSKLINALKHKLKEKKEDVKNFVWNFPEEEEFKGNETRVSFAIHFKRYGFADYASFLTQEKEISLWHYLYSVSYKERIENDNKSIKSFFDKFLTGSNVSEEVKSNLIKDFINYPKFPSKYCAYSEKALKKLLPFIRMGENRFKGKFDISVFESDLRSINHNKANIPSHLGIAKENLATFNDDERRSLEAKRQNLYEALWKDSINKRIAEIIGKLKNVDFNADSVDYSKVVSNGTENGNLPFPKGLFNTFKSFEKAEYFTNLDLTKASYLVYGRHSELAQAKYWTSPEQIRKELHQGLKQHSLNNPVAEKVILEMMQIVAKIWETYGVKNKDNTYEKLFDRIHLEVGRELKKTAKEKESITKNQNANKVQNKRLRQVLEEFLANNKYNAIAQNNDHFERLKIVEEGAGHTKNTEKKFFESKPYSKKEIEDILKKPLITQADFEKYKLWIEQGYKSPYTNKIIKLTDLFNGNKYNVDHVFPQASITNDSLSNKVVCEIEINKLKSNQTGRGFVNNPQQRRVPCVAHKTKENSEGFVDIVDDDTYVSIVKAQFSGTKRFILLSEEIPKGFTNSQLNNARHIARKAMELLSHIVREQGEVEFRSKNVLPVTGEITNKLKKAWKLDQVWKELVAPRFIRMNELTKSNLFGQWQISKSGQKYFDCNLDDTIREKNESFDIKRIDHRHHALDALIVALCTEEHVNYINNINANVKSDDYGKQKQIEKYRETLKKKIKFSQPKKEDPNEKNWFYMLPGEIRQIAAENSSIETVFKKSYLFKERSFEKGYQKMILSALQHTAVAFKQNLRVINKTINRYNSKPDKNKFEKQKGEEKGNKSNWAIRRSLGKDTFYGRVNLKLKEKKELHSVLKEIYDDISIVTNKEIRKKLKEIKSNNDFESFKNNVKEVYSDNPTIELYYFTDNTKDKKKIASREFLSEEFGLKKIGEITDIGIQKILFNHLKQFDTVELPFEESLQYYYDAVLEKQELEAIVKDSETKFQSIQDFTEFLKLNNFKYNKADYAKLNVFIGQILDRDFRSEEQFRNSITEHPEIAFTSEEIDKMNAPENLKRLNEGTNHTPIRKVRVSRGFGSQRALSENLQSVKSKQYVVNDAGSNLYLGFYERTYVDNAGNEVTERKFQDIGLIELIESLKQNKTMRLNPLPDKIYDDNKNEYNWIFTLSPLDLVYVPTEDEIENPTLVKFENLNEEQCSRLYKYTDGGGGIANFIPYTVAQPIWKFHDDKKKKEIHSLLKEKHALEISEKDLIKDEFGFGSQQTKNQNMIDGKTPVKKICWKLKVDRLGNVKRAVK